MLCNCLINARSKRSIFVNRINIIDSKYINNIYIYYYIYVRTRIEDSVIRPVFTYFLPAQGGSQFADISF